jgi:hypothetical protein
MGPTLAAAVAATVRLEGAVSDTLFTEAVNVDAELAWPPQFPLVPHPDNVANRKRAVKLNIAHFFVFFILISFLQG